MEAWTSDGSGGHRCKPQPASQSRGTQFVTVFSLDLPFPFGEIHMLTPVRRNGGGVEPDGRASLAKARHVSSRPHDMLPASHFKGVAKTFGCAHCQGHCHYLLFPFVPKAILAVCWFLLATRSIPLRILTKRSEGVWVSINLELCQSIAMREREREEKERKRERGKRERTN